MNPVERREVTESQIAHCQADGALIKACQLGDRDAQSRLYEQYSQRVFQLMVRMVGTQEAADLTQQVFLQVYRKIQQFSGRSMFSTWLYRVAVNEALQQRRRSQSRPVQPLHIEPASDANALHVCEGQEVFERALAAIEPELRTIFLLREVDQLSYSQLADVLELPEGTVASRLNRARRELKEALQELDTS